MSGWNKAVDAQTTLAHAAKTDQYTRYLANFADDRTEKLIEQGTTENAARAASNSLAAASMATVLRGVPVWINDDVLTMVEAASESGQHGETNRKGEPLKVFEPEAIYLDHLFEPCAFCLLERPLSMIDTRGNRCAYRAMGWMLAEVVKFGDKDPPRAPGLVQWQGDTSELSLVYCTWAHRDDGDDYIKAGEYPFTGGSELTLQHATVFDFGDDSWLNDGPTTEIMRQVQILWKLAKSTVVSRTRERPERHARKRAARQDLTINDVVVMRLRHARKRNADKPEGDGEGAGYSHRFPVAGHWRDQYYPSRGPATSRAAHSQIWIDEYIKGDPDKPFVAKKRAVEFIR